MNEYNYNYATLDDNITDRQFLNNMMPDFMQTDFLSNINYLPNFDNAQMKMMNKQQSLDPYKGFMRGNLFDGLYEPYKNYKPSEINPTNEREAMLAQWQQYNFALVDLNLYLDTHPNDQEALNLFKKYKDIKRQITDKYEKKYGPLTFTGDISTSSWNWINSPWPWEVIK